MNICAYLTSTVGTGHCKRKRLFFSVSDSHMRHFYLPFHNSLTSALDEMGQKT